MTITKKALFFLGAAFFLTCSSTYIKVQAAQNMPDKSVQIGKKTTMPLGYGKAVIPALLP